MKYKSFVFTSCKVLNKNSFNSISIFIKIFFYQTVKYMYLFVYIFFLLLSMKRKYILHISVCTGIWWHAPKCFTILIQYAHEDNDKNRNDISLKLIIRHFKL